MALRQRFAWHDDWLHARRARRASVQRHRKAVAHGADADFLVEALGQVPAWRGAGPGRSRRRGAAFGVFEEITHPPSSMRSMAPSSSAKLSTITSAPAASSWVDFVVAPGDAERLHARGLGHVHVVHRVADHHRFGLRGAGLFHRRVDHLRIGLAAIVVRRLHRMEAIEDAVPLEQRDRAAIALAGRHREDGVRIASAARPAPQARPRNRGSRATPATPAIVRAVALENLSRAALGRPQATGSPIASRAVMPEIARMVLRSGTGSPDGGEGVGDGLDDHADRVDQRPVQIEDDEAQAGILRCSLTTIKCGACHAPHRFNCYG
jgi:hypothetical protein